MTNLAVGCYGKLPLHGDFIRHNHSTHELAMLDRWVQEGFVYWRAQMGSHFDDAFDRAPISRFVFNSIATGRVVVGIIMPGCDKVGRQYPFIVYTGMPSSLFGGEYTLVPGIFQEFFERARAISSDWIGKDLRTFIGRIDSLAFSIDVHDRAVAVARELGRSNSQTTWNNVFGSAQDLRKYMVVQNLVDGIKPGLTPKFALRFPNSPTAAEVMLWLEMTNKLCNRRVLPAMTMWAWPKDDSPASVTLVMDQLDPKLMMPLLQPEQKADNVLNLASHNLGDDGKMRTARQRFGHLVDDPALPLRDLVARLTR